MDLTEHQYRRPTSSEPPGYSDHGSVLNDDKAIEEEESLLQDNGNVKSQSKGRSRKVSFWSKTCSSLNLLLSIFNLGTVLTLAIIWSGQNGRNLTKQDIHVECPSTKEVRQPSPAHDAIERELRPFTLTSPYNQHPSDKTDKLWEDLVDTGAMFPISPEMFAAVNDSPETGVTYTHDPQGRYVATLASTHQVHCVDALRKGLWFHYKHYKAKNDPIFMDADPPEKHLMHCVEMLRNAVMCSGDVSLVTYNWKKGHPGPKASFKSLHSCAKWDKIAEWRSAHNVTKNIKTLMRPIGIFDGKDGKPTEKGEGASHGAKHEDEEEENDGY